MPRRLSVSRQGLLWAALPTAVALWAMQAGDAVITVAGGALAAGLAFLFRVTPPNMAAAPLGILSPVSGSVVKVERTEGIRLPRSALCLTIRVGLLDGYDCYSPTEGLIRECWHRPPAEADLSSRSASRYYSFWVRTDEGDDVLVEHYSPALLGAVGLKLQPGERIGQGQPYGNVRFGGTVRCYLPENSELIGSVGDRVQAGQSILARLVHTQALVAATGAPS
ncbi:MAG: hypothetical protein J4A00_05650 [Gammaproteobacteria bacterium]|nr:hypothetical protein [Gammaproteobacteria bacterium]